jgi:hypothetical protein
MRIISILDSLPTKESFLKEVKEKLEKFFSSEFELRKVPCLQQNNGWECGWFTLLNIENYLFPKATLTMLQLKKSLKGNIFSMFKIEQFFLEIYEKKFLCRVQRGLTKNSMMKVIPYKESSYFRSATFEEAKIR